MRRTFRHLGKTVLLGGVLAVMMSAQAAEPTAKPKAPDLRHPSVTESVSMLEADMSALGKLVNDAKRQKDMVQLACLQQKYESAAAVMEVATGELLVAQDKNAAEDARVFAAQKLRAAAERLRRLMREAEGCTGALEPEEDDDVTRNESNEPNATPWPDPTVEPSEPPVPPAVDPAQPQVASPVHPG